MSIVELISEGKIKRLFRARNKISYPGAICHITQRAPGREPLFLEEADYLSMLRLFKEKAREFNLDLFSFVLMPNHIHLLIRLNKENLSQAMKNIFENYARYFNKKYERKGHVFCGSYRCALCLDEGYLIAASIYIHLNPQRAGLVNSFIEYRWSSILPYISAFKKQTFLNYHFILNILDEDLDKAREEYKRLLEEMSQMRMRDALEDPKSLLALRAKLIRSLGGIFKDVSGPVGGDLLADSELEERIEKLRARRRLTTPQQVEARRFLIEQLLARGLTVSEIAGKLRLTPQSIYRILK